MSRCLSVCVCVCARARAKILNSPAATTSFDFMVTRSQTTPTQTQTQTQTHSFTTSTTTTSTAPRREPRVTRQGTTQKRGEGRGKGWKGVGKESRPSRCAAAPLFSLPLHRQCGYCGTSKNSQEAVSDPEAPDARRRPPSPACLPPTAQIREGSTGGGGWGKVGQQAVRDPHACVTGFAKIVRLAGCPGACARTGAFERGLQVGNRKRGGGRSPPRPAPLAPSC